MYVKDNASDLFNFTLGIFILAVEGFEISSPKSLEKFVSRLGVVLKLTVTFN